MERVDSLGDGFLVSRLAVMNAFYRRKFRLTKRERIAVRMYWGIKTGGRRYVYREVAKRLGLKYPAYAREFTLKALRKLEFAWPRRETLSGGKVVEGIRAEGTPAIHTALCLALDLPLIQPVVEYFPYVLNRQLTKLQRWIIYLRFFCGHSITETATLSNITAKKVHRTETVALRKIRRYVVSLHGWQRDIEPGFGRRA